MTSFGSIDLDRTKPFSSAAKTTQYEIRDNESHKVPSQSNIKSLGFIAAVQFH